MDQGLESVKSWLRPLFEPYARAAYQLVRTQHGLPALSHPLPVARNIRPPQTPPPNGRRQRRHSANSRHPTPRQTTSRSHPRSATSRCSTSICSGSSASSSGCTRTAPGRARARRRPRCGPCACWSMESCMDAGGGTRRGGRGTRRRRRGLRRWVWWWGEFFVVFF